MQSLFAKVYQLLPKKPFEQYSLMTEFVIIYVFLLFLNLLIYSSKNSSFYKVSLLRVLYVFIIIIPRVMSEHQPNFFIDPQDSQPIPIDNNYAMRGVSVDSHFYIQPQNVDQSILQDEQSNHPQQQQQQYPQQSIINLFKRNILKYPYSRGYHYFANLDIFPRDHSSKSYAIDGNNFFKNTYLKDDVVIGGNRIGQIINRTHFTLPSDEFLQRSFRNSGRNNLNKQQLFKIQNQKIEIDQLIITYRQILNNLQALIMSGKIIRFEGILSDSRLEGLLEGQPKVSEIRVLLIRKLQAAMESKRVCQKYWKAEDCINSQCSRNQNFHKKVSDQLLSFKIQRSIIIKKRETLILKFGSEKALSFARIALSNRVYGFGRQYINSLSQRLFNVCLPLIISDKCEDKRKFVIEGSKIVRKIRQICKRQQNKIKCTFPQQNQSQQNLQSHISSQQQFLNIGAKDLSIILQIRWLSSIMNALYPILLEIPNLIQAMSSKFYFTMAFAVGEAVNNPIVSTYQNCLNQLRGQFEHLLMYDYGNKIKFKYLAQQSVGIVSFEHVDQRNDEQYVEDFDIFHFGKRVKSVENQWA